MKQVGNGRIRVTLRNNSSFRKKWIDAGVSGIIGAERAAGLTDFQSRVVPYITERGKINITSAYEAGEKICWPQWPKTDCLKRFPDTSAIVDTLRLRRKRRQAATGELDP
jgi:hypothetical protein